MPQQTLSITWLGHATFLFETPGGKRLLLDPWISQNPAFPEGWQQKLGAGLDGLLLTHGHFDHVSDLVDLARSTKAGVACIYDLDPWLRRQGVENVVGFNKGGTVDLAGVKVTMTDARHSSSFVEGETIVYMGEACGFVLTFENGYRVYHSGDTCVFGDMQLIGELYKPDLAILPIGGHFTMDPLQAAHALRLLGVRRVIPEHYGTFPILAGTPDQLREQSAALGLEVEVIALQPGESWRG